ncbi:hypothetical protein [Maritimibacter dapengensis]|uniref:MacB-like periplasmic core domain-containing protein n=1 Tax=Maritimibacter dapengensis TaxID=2836868 RepID=A0ABS6SZU8_9RHOB|nr:hypothetical protein [Maritimibacter dapengensis]MBV7378514.1 hypothetical protein [Maritimibacter dapengensis]
MSTNRQQLLSIARRLAVGPNLQRSVSILLTVMFALVVVYYLLVREQSFTVYAQTNYAAFEVTTKRPQLWMIGDATLCQRRVKRKAEADRDGLCDGRLFDVQPAELAEITWTEGTNFTLFGDTGNLAALAFQGGEESGAFFNGEPIRGESILYFATDSLAKVETLVLSAKVTIGANAETGETGLLHDGRYEIREVLALTSGASVVATGTFLPGDQIRVIDKDGSRLSMRLLIMPSDTSRAAFGIVATSSPEVSSIAIDRVGAARTHITSKWTDRLSNDSLPLALSIFLGLFGASLGIAKSLTGVREK